MMMQHCKYVFLLVSSPCRLDTGVDPCNDFYDFACGTFIKENYTPDESSSVDTFTKLRDSIDTQVYMLMLNDAKDDEANANFKLSQELFKTCLERNREFRIIARII